MSKHRLWYSTKCRHCQGFLEELARTPFVSQFQLICVDPSPSRPPLPGWLRSVPSLLVVGESEARVGPGPVNNWLFEARLNGSGNSGPKTPQQAIDDRRGTLSAPVYSPDMAPPRGESTSRTNPRTGGSMAVSGGGGGGSGGGAPAAGEPSAYYGSEMEGGMWSDNFSFIGSEFTSDKGVNPIERNFASLIPGGAAGSSAASAAASIAGQQEKRSAKEDALLKEFEAYTANRDRDIGKPVTRMG